MNLTLRDMAASDIEAVLHIEQQVHAHPWTRGNFSDALASDYVCKIAEVDGKTMGYAVLMRGVDDAELLDIGIAAQYQRRGFGRAVLEAMLVLAQELGRQHVVLEVRASNAAAIGLYRALGFTGIGLRRDYYAAPPARGMPKVGNPPPTEAGAELTPPMDVRQKSCHPFADNGREDALLMERKL